MKLRELGDVIAWDQRGTGSSEPQVRVEASVDSPYAGAVSRQWLEAQYRRAGREARAQFKRDGFDPAPLNTNASADDLEDLRLALGVRKLRLWSISYGTHLALATVKQVLNTAFDSTLDFAMNLEGQAYEKLRDSYDYTEGATAFFYKRRAVYKGE